jgi:hypothetical protein
VKGTARGHRVNEMISAQITSLVHFCNHNQHPTRVPTS